jgi:hypothetical protein
VATAFWQKKSAHMNIAKKHGSLLMEVDCSNVSGNKEKVVLPKNAAL